ncbi:MAG: cell division protein FtsZ, partial [Candidatus Nealsonbacteria bacterium CG_4_9_14_0_8_um_filter_35_12]
MKKTKPKIKVVGIGGSGCNAILRMAKAKIEGVELVAINTDLQDLKKSRADFKIRIGKNLTKGLGAGMNPEIGKEAAREQKEEIKEVLKDADMVFITYGAGGGTGSGAGPVIAEISKNLGVLTVAIVTKPFSFEGIFRKQIAKKSLEELKEKVDSLISISNDKLFSVLNPNISLNSAFWACDDILRQAVQGISDLIVLPGIINVDFASVKSVLKNSGTALFGIGLAEGEKRAQEAALKAINSPLLDRSCKGAKGILFNVAGGRDISLSEIEEVAKIITKEVNPEAKIIFGAVQSENLKKGEIKVTVIAT